MVSTHSEMSKRQQNNRIGFLSYVQKFVKLKFTWVKNIPAYYQLLK